jgi:uncharacterized protein
MPMFALICIDKADSIALRLANRTAHLAYTGRHMDKIRVAGPLTDEAGTMNGSLLLMEADSIEAIRAFNAADPYTLAGLFERVEIRPWRQSVPPPP